LILKVSIVVKKAFLYILFLLAMPCFAQPTGHQKLFLEITDNGDTVDFKRCFRKNEYKGKSPLKLKHYQLSDKGRFSNGFKCYKNSEYIFKTLMVEDHFIEIVKDKKDTMRIELLDAFKVYFLSISFQKGHFRLIVNDGAKNKSNVNAFPLKPFKDEQVVYDLTPKDWKLLQVDATKSKSDNVLATQIEEQQQKKSDKPIDLKGIQTKKINRLTFVLNKSEWVKCAKCMGCFCHSFTVTADDHSVLFNQYRTFQRGNGMAPAGIDSFQVLEIDAGFYPDFKLFFANAQPEHYTYQKASHTYLLAAELNIQKPIDANTSDSSEKQSIVHTFYKGSLKFELLKNCPNVNIPAQKGYYANRISVYEHITNELIYSTIVIGNRLNESENCSDSIQIEDYNFDGLTDFRVCNSHVPGKHTYYLYHPANQTFVIEKTLSELNSLTFDFEKKTAKGHTDVKSYMSRPWTTPSQFCTEQLHFEGKGLENLTVITNLVGKSETKVEKFKYVNQKRYDVSDNYEQLMLQKKTLVKEFDGFRFEFEFHPDDTQLYNEKGGYVKYLNIYHHFEKVGQFEIHGNYHREVAHWLDSMEIADYNFDGYPDIRVYNSFVNDGRYNYFIFNPNREVNAFFIESLFSSITKTEFNPKAKILKGKIVEANQTIHFFLKNDTLTLSNQSVDLNQPLFIEESIYRYGNKFSLRSAYNQLDAELKSEFGDFNFDGYQDYRRKSKTSPYYWDVFIYNPQNESFEKDTLLSKFEVFNFDEPSKYLEGYYRIRSNATTWITQYYRWSFSENKMILYKQMHCYSRTPMSESQRCVISEWIDGKWVETEEFGAE
jgi:hypothetical protein